MALAYKGRWWHAYSAQTNIIWPNHLQGWLWLCCGDSGTQIHLHLTFTSCLNILRLFSLMDGIVVLIQCTPSTWHPDLGAEIYPHTHSFLEGLARSLRGLFFERKSRCSVLGVRSDGSRIRIGLRELMKMWCERLGRGELSRRNRRQWWVWDTKGLNGVWPGWWRQRERVRLIPKQTERWMDGCRTWLPNRSTTLRLISPWTVSKFDPDSL